MIPKRALPLLAICFLVIAAPAQASDPSSGTVSLASPDVKWTGVAQGYGVVPANILITAGGEDPQCPPEACDTFDLTVADQADLVVTAACRSENNFTELHVVNPAGEMVYVQSAQGSPATLKVKNAAKGAYRVEVLTNDPVFAGGEYDATAHLGGAAATKPAATPAPGATPAPASTPAPAAAPAPAPSAAPAARLTLTTTKLSAKRARKVAALKLAASAPVTGLTAAIRKGSKVIATGRLAKLTKSGTVRLKLKRPLKKGSYTVALSAKDGAGNTVGSISKLKVTK